MPKRWFLPLSVVAAFAIISCSTSQSMLVPRSGAPAIKHKSVVETVLYSFGGRAHDGERPLVGLIKVSGALYGTTFSGGTYRGGRICGQYGGCGAVVSITPSGNETVVYGLFEGVSHGANPVGSLTYLKGKLYGATAYGGLNACTNSGGGCGTVFSLTTNGMQKVLHRFHGSDGELPQAGLANVSGTFYGTTALGGAHGNGTVFSITPSGAYHLLYSFGGGHDGAYPYAGLVGVKGKLYGTTSAGGRYGIGTVFSITTSGSEKLLHAFSTSDGNDPQSGLLNVNGKLYGTTFSGGQYSQGTVFSITTNGAEKVLYSFAGGNDGANPSAHLINVNGILYGTTVAGGAAGCRSSGCGTVFSITTAGAETVLYSFAGVYQGAYPYARLINVNGTLYGTTSSGGQYGHGTVYTITGY